MAFISIETIERNTSGEMEAKIVGYPYFIHGLLCYNCIVKLYLLKI